MLSRNQGHSTARRIKAMKNTLTSLEIEPETFRLIAQDLNQLGRRTLVLGNHVVLSPVGLNCILGLCL